MKSNVFSKCFVLVVAITCMTVLGHQSGVFGTSSTYYMSNFPKGSDPDDTKRIRRAIAAVSSGTLVFDEGLYTVSDSIKLRAHLTIKGTSANTNLTIGQAAHIRMTVANRPIFIMGCNPTSPGYDADDPDNASNTDECSDYDESIAIRDLGLSTSTSGNIGILANGDRTYTSTAKHIEFKNVRFTGFSYGIKAEALDGFHDWQFDNVKVDHCLFEFNSTSIYIDSYNSGWQISSTEFGLGSGAIGIHMKRGTYSTIDSVNSNGTAIPTPIAYASILIEEHGTLRISNAVSEGVDYDLKVDGDPSATTHNNFYPIHLDSNSFQGKVEISDATIISTANQFGLEFGMQGAGSSTPSDHRDDYQKPMPIAKDNTHVYSFGDKFCFDYLPDTCENQGWVLQSGAIMKYGIGQFKNLTTVPSYMQSYLSVERAIDFRNATTIDTPLVSIFSKTYETRPLLRLGHHHPSNPDYHYTFTRNSTTGFLEVNGNQESPSRGLRVNGPVTLPLYTYANLPLLYYADQYGSLVYCSNCQANSSPCTTGTSGALALWNGATWSCK